MLNLNAWFILELCDGSSMNQLEQKYCQQVASQMSEVDARCHLVAGLNDLREQGLIELKPANE